MKDLIKLLDEPLKFEEAIKYFKGKLPLTPKAFYQLAEKYKAHAFTVSGYSQLNVLNQFHDELLKSVSDGTTMEQFKSNMNSFLEDKGYKGITAFQSDNIYRTNIQTAYSVGHYEQMNNPAVKSLRPYWQYDAVDDNRSRLSHRAMDGKVYHADHPIWDVWYPPNGYRCRCGVKTLSKRQVESLGLTVQDKMPTAGMVDGHFVNILPDKNFATNPAKTPFKPDLKDYPKSLVKAYNARQEKQ